MSTCRKSSVSNQARSFTALAILLAVCATFFIAASEATSFGEKLQEIKESIVGKSEPEPVVAERVEIVHAEPIAYERGRVVHTHPELGTAERVKDAAADAAHVAKEKLASAGEAAADTARNAKDKTVDAAYVAKEKLATAGEYVGDKLHDAKDVAADAAHVAKEKLATAGEYVGDKLHDAKDVAADAAHVAKEKLATAGEFIGDKLASAGEAIGEKARNAKEATAEAAQNAKDKLANAGESVADTARNAKDATVETAQNAKDKLADAAHRKDKYHSFDDDDDEAWMPHISQIFHTGTKPTTVPAQELVLPKTRTNSCRACKLFVKLGEKVVSADSTDDHMVTFLGLLCRMADDTDKCKNIAATHLQTFKSRMLANEKPEQICRTLEVC